MPKAKTEPTSELYILTPVRRHAHDAWQVDGSTTLFIFRATSPRDARNRAAELATEAEAEGPEVWLNPAETNCRRLNDDGELGLVAREWVQ